MMRGLVLRAALLGLGLLGLVGCAPKETTFHYQVPPGVVVVFATQEDLQKLAESRSDRKVPENCALLGFVAKDTKHIYLGQLEQGKAFDHELEHVLGIRPPEPVPEDQKR